MNNVVKMAVKKKKPDIAAWKAQIEVLGDKLEDRVSDAIRLADEEAIDEAIPEDFTDCAILGVLAAILVDVSHARNVLGPEALLKLVEHQIRHQIEKNLKK